MTPYIAPWLWNNRLYWKIIQTTCDNHKGTNYLLSSMTNEAEWRLYASVNQQSLVQITLVAWTEPSHYLNQCWNIVNWTLRNKLHWNFNRNSNIFVQEKWTWKCLLRNGVHFVWASMRETICGNIDDQRASHIIYIYIHIWIYMWGRLWWYTKSKTFGLTATHFGRYYENMPRGFYINANICTKKIHQTPQNLAYILATNNLHNSCTIWVVKHLQGWF